MVRQMQTPPKYILPPLFSNFINLLKFLLRLCFLHLSKFSSSSDEDGEEEEDVESLLWAACFHLQTFKQTSKKNEVHTK